MLDSRRRGQPPTHMLPVVQKAIMTVTRRADKMPPGEFFESIDPHGRTVSSPSYQLSPCMGVLYAARTYTIQI